MHITSNVCVTDSCVFPLIDMGRNNSLVNLRRMYALFTGIHAQSKQYIAFCILNAYLVVIPWHLYEMHISQL